MNKPTNVVEIVDGALAAVQKTPPDEARNKKRTEQWLALAEGLVVDSPEAYEFAVDQLRQAIALHDEIEEDRVSFTGPLNETLRRLNLRFQPYIKALRDGTKPGTVETIIKGKMAAYTAEQERLRREEQQRAEALAAAERKRVADEAEAVRRKAEEDRLAAEAAERKRKDEAAAEQRRLDAIAASARTAKARKEAEEAAEKKRLEDEAAERRATEQRAAAAQQAELEAQALESTAAVITVPVVQQVTQVAGISNRKTVDYEVTDLAAFLAFALEKRPDLLEVVDLNATKMRALVKVAGLKTAYPGVRVFEKTSVAVR